MDKQELKRQILDLTRQYHALTSAEAAPFVAGESRVNYGGRWYDAEEMVNLVDASLDFWLTAGPWARRFETGLARWLGVRHCALCNSGSSANLLAFMALCQPELGERAVRPGDEVITVAAGFPTTVAPIVQAGAVPVFVDMRLGDCNIDPAQLEAALSQRTKAVVVAHSLGNPFDLPAVMAFCEAHGLWLMEDNCDALGSEVLYNKEWRKTGTVGHIGTSSFYPPHHMTMGEGGAVYTNDDGLDRVVRSLRDWGRDCWCVGGVDNTCGRRFTGHFGQLPEGYDHKYVYSRLGYNLKATDLQAAIGCAQLAKLDQIVERRRHNFDTLSAALAGTPGLALPQASPGTRPSWFGYFILVESGAPFSRNELTGHLERHKVQTRNLFAGNLLRHPAFERYRRGRDYRVVGDLANTDRIMNDGFWIGVYPGMTDEKLLYMADTIKSLR